MLDRGHDSTAFPGLDTLVGEPDYFGEGLAKFSSGEFANTELTQVLDEDWPRCAHLLMIHHSLERRYSIVGRATQPQTQTRTKRHHIQLSLRIRQLVTFRKCTLLYKPDRKLRFFSATSVTALSTTSDVLPQFAAYGLVLS